jgi:hypothetical protein
MANLEKAIKDNFLYLREHKSKEIYFYNEALFALYVTFIETQKCFLRRVPIKECPKKVTVSKIVKKTTPSLKERHTTFQAVMNRAQRLDNDEFYTRYEDVEKEISKYDKSIWENKIVFCNCDDAVGYPINDNNTSAFSMYFLKHFKDLKLKKLICTHFNGQVDLFNQGARGYIFTKTGFRGVGEKNELDGYNGSFDHPLSLEILNKEADIVCTNPPFSRAIDYWFHLIKSGKKFLIISNITNTRNTAFIHYFKSRKVWAGYNEVSEFLNPRKEIVRAAGFWYTNLKIKDRPKHKLLKIIPLKQIPEKYRQFDDAGILLVDHGYIPINYKKPFAVSPRPILNGVLEKGYEIVDTTRYTPYINSKEQFSRVLIQKQKD